MIFASALRNLADPVPQDQSGEVEFYPGLVIYGPLQATLLLNLAISQGGSLPRRFTFRGISPACGPQILRARAWAVDDGFDLATETSSGVAAMKATAIW